jgi:hypothetical protein
MYYPVTPYRRVPENLFPKFDKYADPPGYDKIKPKLFSPAQNLSPNPNLLPPTNRINSPGIQIAPNMNFNLNVTNIVQRFDNPFEEEEHSTNLPYFPEEILKLMHNFGYALLKDDAHDIGFLRYDNRRGHPPHPSALHHYPVGIALMTIAQIGGMVAKMKEFMEVGAEMGDLSGLDLEDFEQEAPQPQRLPPLRVYGTPSSDDPQLLPSRSIPTRIARQEHKALPQTPQLPPPKNLVPIPTAPKLPSNI